MPVKTKKLHHHNPHDKTGHRRARRFLKVYAPYIPLMLIVGLGLFVSLRTDQLSRSTHHSQVLSYATESTSGGLLEATNRQRVRSGLGELSINPQLTEAAQKKAEDMASRNYWSHNTPDGKEPWYFIQNAGYLYSKAAENLAYGFNTSGDTVVGWMNSPSHRANVLDAELKEVGFGIINVPSYQSQGPETIVVAMYGAPLNVATLAPTDQQTSPTQPQPTAQTVAAASAQKISLGQSITGGALPWINFVAGVLIGVIIVYLIMSHGINLRRTFRRGERFILHHPLFDITLIALLGLMTLLSQTAGTIY